LKNLCEYPLLENKTHIDKSKSIKKICIDNYSKKELLVLIDNLNKYKKEILIYAFLGIDKKYQPEYLICSEYIDNKRIRIIFLKIENIINYLYTLNFKINKSKTVISLGNNILTLQRKGGDSGRKSSNQLQIKITISLLLEKIKYLEYKL